MRQRLRLLFAGLLVLAAVGGSFLSHSLTGQAQVAAPVEAAGSPGRYQVGIGGNATYVVVIDSKTGRCWTHSYGGGGWNDLGTPAK